jgi:hypothetical protein
MVTVVRAPVGLVVVVMMDAVKGVLTVGSKGVLMFVIVIYAREK